jgi:hypothetical protein
MFQHNKANGCTTEESGFEFRQGGKRFFSSQRPGLLWDTPSFLRTEAAGV